MRVLTTCVDRVVNIPGIDQDMTIMDMVSWSIKCGEGTFHACPEICLRMTCAPYDTHVHAVFCKATIHVG